MILNEINFHLEKRGVFLKEGSIVGASIIEAPTSTKNKSGTRDSELHQTKKGNQWHFGMKMHVGVDEASELVHTIKTTSANHHDVTQTKYLIRKMIGDYKATRVIKAS